MVVFIVDLPLTDRDFHRFGFTTFLRNGFAVIVLEAGRFIARGKNDPQQSSTMEFSDIDKRSVNNSADLRREQGTFDAANLIICAFGSGFVFPENFSIFRAISRTQTPYLLMMSNYLPVDYEFSNTIGEKISIFAAKILRIDLIRSVLARLPPWACGLRPADYVVFGGRRSIVSRPLFTKKTIMIHAHAMDYDLFLQEKKMCDGLDETAVYIDQNVGMHPDAIKQGNKGIVSVNKFYPALRKLLHQVEIQTGLQIVIAAHPKTEAGNIMKLLPGREVFHGATSRLIRESKIVIASYSTAIGLAILFDKPILIITSDEIRTNRYLIGFVENMARSLGIVPVNIDHGDEVDIAAYTTVHIDRRKEYINNFIKQTGSPEKPYWDIVLNAVRDNEKPRLRNKSAPKNTLDAGT